MTMYVMVHMGFFLVDIKILAFHNGIPKPSYRQEEKKTDLKRNKFSKYSLFMTNICRPLLAPQINHPCQDTVFVRSPICMLILFFHHQGWQKKETINRISEKWHNFHFFYGTYNASCMTSKKAAQMGWWNLSLQCFAISWWSFQTNVADRLRFKNS